jgi:hypothetical protein
MWRAGAERVQPRGGAVILGCHRLSPTAIFYTNQ